MIQQIISGTVKEIKLLKSQKIALALIILYPLLIGASLGIVYSGQLGQEISVGLIIEGSAMPEQQDSGSKSISSAGQIDFAQEMRQIEALAVIEYTDRDSLKRDVENGAIKSGAIVSRGQKNGPYKIEVITDNSSMIGSQITKYFVMSAVDRATTQITIRMLNKIWQNFLSSEENLKLQKERIAVLRASFEETKPAIRGLEGAIDSLDINSIKGSLDEARKQSDSLATSIQRIRGQANSFSSVNYLIKDMNQQIYAETEELSLLSAVAQELNNEIDYYSYNGYMNDISYEGRNEMASQVDHIRASTASASRALRELAGKMGVLEEQNAKFAEDMNYTVSGMENTMGSIDLALSGIEESASSLGPSLAQLKSFVSEWNGFEAEVEEDLDETDALIDDLLLSMEEIKTYPPEMLASPTQLWFNDLYANMSVFSLLLPAGLAIVMFFTAILLTTLSVVNERKQRIYLRLQTSPTSRIAQLAGKICGNTAIVMLECGLLLALSVVAFSATINCNIAELFVALLIPTLFFVSIGLFLSIFLKTESSAVLGSLLIAIPALLVSGVLIPFELMPAGIQAARMLNPISLTIAMLTGTMVKGQSIAAYPAIIVVMLSVAIILILAKYFRKE